MEIEKSENGQPIYRYDNVEKAAFTPAHGDADSIEAISNHIEKYIGKIEMVFHENIYHENRLLLYLYLFHSH